MILSAETGIEVEVRWDASASSHGRHWHVVWADGPTDSGMRGHAERILHLRGADLDAADLIYLRTVQPLSVALCMVRNVRLGQPPLGDHRSLCELEDALRQSSYPEQSSEDDIVLATQLGQLTNFNEAAMPEVLAAHGIAGLRAQLAPPDNVLPLFGRASSRRTARPKSAGLATST